MAKSSEIDKQINDLSKKLSEDEALSKELSQLSDIIKDLSDIDENNHRARWPYADANPISESAWRD